MDIEIFTLIQSILIKTHWLAINSNCSKVSIRNFLLNERQRLMSLQLIGWVTQLE